MEQRRHPRLRGRLWAVALLVAFASPAAVARADPAPPPVPPAKKPSSGEVKATVSVYQGDDFVPDSPGIDYRARMSWWSTEEEGTRSPDRTSLAGKGNFSAAVDATIVRPAGTSCGNTRYHMKASGAVHSVTGLTFSFAPRTSAGLA